MLLQHLCLLVLLNYVTSDSTTATWTDTAGRPIEVTQHCKHRKCVVKCCPDGQFIAPTKKGIKCVEPKLLENKAEALNLKNIHVYKWDEARRHLIDSHHSLPATFNIIKNSVLSNANATVTISSCNMFILEDGSLISNSSKHDGSCLTMAALEYCVDFFPDKLNGKVRAKLAFRAARQDEKDAKKKHAFIAAGMLVSVVFMSLVVCVYVALPRLRNIVGLVLVAYLATLAVAFLTKSAQLLALSATAITPHGCSLMSPVVYYFIIASFFWLNVMSFDLWWTIRGSRKRRDIHRAGELVKFMWYALYGWGAPALLTLAVIAIDRLKLYTRDQHRPPFSSCFAETTSTSLYVHIPLGVMTSANSALFVMTAYNVWLVKRAINNMKDADNTKNNENRFIIYIKLSVLMGVSWMLELIPDGPLVPFIFVNFYNVFIGVAIFLMFVCKRDVLVMLCKKYHLSNKWVEKLGGQASQYTKSESERSSSHRKGSRTTRNDDDNEATELTVYTHTDKL